MNYRYFQIIRDVAGPMNKIIPERVVKNGQKIWFEINNNNNIYLLQLGCYPKAVVILHVHKTSNWLLLNLSREGYMRSM
jgi:radical SAM superfamily enzyme with C-terminal helix-hairpin-helix motif